MKFLVLIPLILLIGCASTAKNMDLVSVGMTKQAVIYVLGEPAETRASEDIEYLFYRLRTAPRAEVQAGCGAAGVPTLGLVYLLKGCQYSSHDYFVLLQQGAVTAYGRIGDTDASHKTEATTKVPAPIEEAK